MCYLLSFANGGYLGPTVIRANRWTPTKSEVALYGAYRVTPIELLGDTWLSFESDLCDFLACFPAFVQMIQTDVGKKLYELALTWYFQAIQPSSAQLRGKPWQVAIVALAALIERMTYEFANEIDGKAKGKPELRLKYILERLGISKSLYQDQDVVELFYEMRNNATHPRQTKTYSSDDIQFVFQYATLWVEELLLWRLGYKGKYRNRLRTEGNYVFDVPRYDLSCTTNLLSQQVPETD